MNTLPGCPIGVTYGYRLLLRDEQSPSEKAISVRFEHRGVVARETPFV